MRLIPMLLNRIRWNPEFARWDFQLGCFGQVENLVILIPFKEARFPPDGPPVLQFVNAEGRTPRVPFHPVREVHNNSQPIWRRPEPGNSAASGARQLFQVASSDGVE